MGRGLKHTRFYVQRHNNTSRDVYITSSQQAARSTRICGTRLWESLWHPWRVSDTGGKGERHWAITEIIQLTVNFVQLCKWQVVCWSEVRNAMSDSEPVMVQLGGPTQNVSTVCSDCTSSTGLLWCDFVDILTHMPYQKYFYLFFIVFWSWYIRYPVNPIHMEY